MRARNCLILVDLYLLRDSKDMIVRTNHKLVELDLVLGLSSYLGVVLLERQPVLVEKLPLLNARSLRQS